MVKGARLRSKDRRECGGTTCRSTSTVADVVRQQFDVTAIGPCPAWKDTICPFCQAQDATRLLSSFVSTVKGDHKPGFRK
jgi:hypothetical protein